MSRNQDLDEQDKLDLTSYERERMFAEKLANVFLFDNKVQVAKGEMNIAYCNVNKKQIWFDFAEIFSGVNEKVFKEMMTFKGLGFHEILHLKYTMRSKRRLSNELMALLQRLEDGRIETLGVMEFQKLADYLIFAVNNVLLKDKKRILDNTQDEVINTYILCYGRTIYFQDKELMAKIREMIIKTYGREVVEKIEDCIDRYIPEVSSNKRILIAEELLKYLNSKRIRPDFQREMSLEFIDTRRIDPKKLPKEMQDLIKQFPRLKVVRQEINKELKDKTKDVKDVSPKREEFEDKKEKELEDLRSKRKKLFEKMYDEEDQDKREKMRKKINDVQDEMEDKSQETFKPDSDDDKDSKGGDQTTKSFSPDGEGSPKGLDEMLDEKEDEQEDLVDKNKEDLTGDLKSMGKSIDEIYSDASFNIDGKMRSMATQLEKGLKKLNNELVKGYVSKQKSGRVNVKRFINRQSLTDSGVFNKWLPDRLQQTKILVNLFVDGSGSMNGDRWKKAINSCWIINEALNRDENKIMVYQFSSGHQLVKEYDKPLSVPKMIGGGTNPASAIKDAIPRIEAYKRAKSFRYVVNIIITDGEFETRGDSDNAIQQMNKLGQETLLIHIGSGYQNSNVPSGYKHNAKHYLGLHSFDALVPETVKIFTQIKRVLIRKAKVL